ncbi:hypothetical protein [Corynebacterium hiratae]|uniref:hypothetical protein n=1 Tax=Corynebacterium hiratae TaxID=3139423 RepID=UPI00272E19A7|nr:hypothetical protein [Corynebacterium aurimucosum]
MRLSRVLGSVLGPVAVAAGLVAAPAVAHADQPTINWGPCPEGVTEERAECGHVTVPTYHDAPEKGTIDVVSSASRPPETVRAPCLPTRVARAATRMAG